MAPAAMRSEGRRLRSRRSGFALLAAASAGLLAAASVGGGVFVAPGRPGKRPASLRGAGIAAPRRAGEAPAEGEQLWSLVVGRTDHYVWRDKDIFVGIVADAGEWTIDLDIIRKAFDEAQDEGTAEVFSAPLYVVKDYVRELQNYGLAAQARKAEAPEGGEGVWRRRDWDDLPPELKEEAGRSRQEGEDAGTRTIVIVKNDHVVFDGSRNAESKFRAYVELASDAAKRFAPDDTELNVCYAKIRGDAGRAPVLRSLKPDAAEVAAEQLRKAGFEVELEEEEVAASGG